MFSRYDIRENVADVAKPHGKLDSCMMPSTW